MPLRSNSHVSTRFICAILSAVLFAQAPVLAACPENEREFYAVIEQATIEFDVRDLDANPEADRLHSFRSDPLGKKMFACNESGAIVELRAQDRALQVTPTFLDAECSERSTLVIEDLNGDGFPDLLFQTKPDAYLRLWRSEGPDAFTDGETLVIGGRLLGIAQPPTGDSFHVVMAYERSLSMHRLELLAQGSHEGPHFVLGEQELPLRTLSPLPELGSFVLSVVARDLILWGLFIDQPIRFRMADFQPATFSWLENTTWTDVNGDLLPDLVSHPPDSRNPWVALNRVRRVFPEQPESQVDMVFIEVPLSYRGRSAARYRLLGGADFNRDQVGDLLLFDDARGRFSIGYSQAAIPAANTAFTYKKQELRSNTEGALCLPSNFSTQQLKPQSSKLVVDSRGRSGQTRRLILREREAATGAQFALGSTAEGPYSCAGYNPSAWHLSPGSIQSKWGMLAHGACSRSHGIYSTSDFLPQRATETWSLGVCCPLPSPDIVAANAPLVRAKLRCPAQHIAVGILHGTPKEEALRILLCRKINTDSYALGEPKSGHYWGHGFSVDSPERIPAEAIPPSIRRGVRRYSHLQDREDGCVGNPPGALLVGFDESKKGCAGHLFSSLQRRSADPPRPADAVSMFPSCGDIRNFLSPLSSCINEGPQ